MVTPLVPVHHQRILIQHLLNCTLPAGHGGDVVDDDIDHDVDPTVVSGLNERFQVVRGSESRVELGHVVHPVSVDCASVRGSDIDVLVDGAVKVLNQRM
jgi:hypothetical protein